MVMQFVDIPVDARGYLIKHRDQWNSEHGVWVSFPPHGARVRCGDGSTITIKRFGNYQTMVLKGSTSDIRVVKRLVSCVLDEASEEREAFNERKRRRMQHSRTMEAPVRKNEKEVRSQRRNMFDGLDISEEVSKPKKVVIVGPKVVTPRAPQGCWASGSPTKLHDVVPTWSKDPKLGAWGDESELGAWGDE